MWWKEDIACPEQINALPNLKRKDQSGFMTQILMHNVMGKMMYALIYWLNTQQFKEEKEMRRKSDASFKG